MGKKNKNKVEENKKPQVEQPEVDVNEVVNEEQENACPEQEPTLEQQVADLKAQLEKEKNQYLFLMADFENFRKRTLKEKADLLKYGGESALRDLLPVVDDMERAIDAINKGGDMESLKEGVDLIYSKFVKYLERNKVVAIESTGMDFDDNLHEAITTFPAPDESLRGKVIDTTTKGYMLDDKVLRHAKVVVGQ